MKPGLLSALRRFIRNTTGQDMVEYALLAGFVAVAAGASLPGIAHNLNTSTRTSSPWSLRRRARVATRLPL